MKEPEGSGRTNGDKMTDHQKMFALVTAFAERNDARCEFDYSGRGMYGRNCFAVVCERWDVEELQNELEAEGLPCGRQDSMGKTGRVIYWPTFTIEELNDEQLALWEASKWCAVEEEEEEEDDEDEDEEEDDEDEDEDDEDEDDGMVALVDRVHIDPVAIGRWLATSPKGRALCG